MPTSRVPRPSSRTASALLGLAIVSSPGWAQSSDGAGAVYRCPGNTYTNALTPQEAREKGCRLVENVPVTVIQPSRPRAPASAGAAPSAAGAAPVARVDPNEQRARDSDARRILEAELRKEEERLAAMQREYNNGEPERRGDERNYQKYLDRVAEMKASISRKEADIAAIKREIAKLPPAN